MPFSPPLRKLTLLIHIIASVGWIGAVIAYLVLDVATFASDDAATLRATYASMHLITTWAIVPLALTALTSGIVISLGTTWGLFRHWWVLLSLILTLFATIVLLVETQVIRQLAIMATDPATTPERLRDLPSTLVHSIGGLVVLVAVAVLNVYKPKGLTSYGWRKQQERESRRP